MENDTAFNNDQKIIAEVVDLNKQLEDKTISNANYAFNLGCFLGLIPAVLIIIAGFFLTGRSWLAAVIIAVLMLLGLMLFANLVAHTSRERTLDRVYFGEIEPMLSSLQDQSGYNDTLFNSLVDKALPAGAPLRNYTTLTNEALTSETQNQENTETIPED